MRGRLLFLIYGGILVELILPAYVFGAGDDFVLIAAECVANTSVLRSEPIESKPGTNNITFCKRKGKTKLICEHRSLNKNDKMLGGNSSTTEEYKIDLEALSHIYFSSVPSANNKFFVNKASHRYVYGMVYLMPEKELLLTKNCAGDYLTVKEFEELSQKAKEK